MRKILFMKLCQLKINFDFFVISFVKKALLFSLLGLLTTHTVLSQNTNYTPLYSSNNFVKTIDFTKPVGTVEGSVSATASGGVSYSIPVFTPPGTNGQEPAITIAYNSQGGNSICGYGWSIGGLSAISRTGKNIHQNGIVAPVSYTDQDAFVLDGMQLFPTAGNNGADLTLYATEVESFSHIKSTTVGSSNNPLYFTVTSKDGAVMEYGNNATSRVFTDDAQNTMFWRLSKIIDVNGNYIEFIYDNTDRDSRIHKILYSGNVNTGLLPYNEINFSYSQKADANTSYESNATLNSKYLLDKITVFHTTDAGNTETVKTYRLNYGFNNTHSLLKEIVEFGGSETAPSLNSTIFLYGDAPQATLVQQTAQFSGECLAGDFNADGKSDILASTYYWYDDTPNDNYTNPVKYTNGYKILLNPQSTTGFVEKTFPQGHLLPENKKSVNFLASDYNKDGRDDVLNVKTRLITYQTGYSERQVERYTIDFMNNTGSFSQDMPLPPIRMIHKSGIFFIPGDFDGDGIQDYISVLRGTNSSWYYPYLVTPGKVIRNTMITGIPIMENDFWPTANGINNKFNAIDFDGDGKQELLIVNGNQASVYKITSSINAVNPLYTDYAATLVLNTIEITMYDRLYMGDFNGDRKTDILQRKQNGQWKILYSTGTNFIATSFTFNQAVNITGALSDHKILVADFNGDGKSDIVHGYPIFVNGTSTSSIFSVYYNKGSISQFYNEQYNYNNVLPNSDIAVGDFNGDGNSDLLLKGNYNAAGEILYFKPLSQERLLQKVTTGHNVTTAFTYKLLTDKTSTPYVYDRSVSLDDPINSNPFNYVQLPMYALSATTIPDGVGGNNITSYFYENALLHRGGKGFMGFKKITAKNNVTGITSIAENDFNTQFASSYPIAQTTLLTVTGQILSRATSNTSFVNVSTNSNKRFWQKTDNSLAIDYISNRATSSSNTYDDYGNITNAIVNVGGYINQTLTPLETSSTNTVFGYFNTPVPAKPDEITVNNTRNGMPTISASTKFYYDALGLMTSQIAYYGLSNAVTTSTGYNNYGNPITASTSAGGVPTRMASAIYDTKGRYVIQTQKAGGNITQTESFAIDSKSGKPLSQTSTDCLTTSNEYDAFGKITKTIFPDANEVTTAVSWHTSSTGAYNTNPYKLFYVQTHFLGGKPDTKLYVDKFGREWKKEIQSRYGADAAWHTILTTYDNRGNVKTKSNMFFPEMPSIPPPPPVEAFQANNNDFNNNTESFIQPVETPRYTTYYFDELNRTTAATNYTGTVTNSYGVLTDGNFEITSTNQAGQVTKQVTDASGKIISTTDNGGELTHDYDSRGNKTAVSMGNTTFVMSLYNQYGKQTTLIDADAGTTSYAYDAYGQLTQQTDAHGNVYNMQYDNFGRPITKTGPEGITTTEYYKDPANPNCNNNNISKITGFNGVLQEYTFDALKRVQTDTKTIDGIAYTNSYTYNPFSQLASTQYPSNLIIYHSYDAGGYLLTTGPTPFFKRAYFRNGQQDGSGNYISYTLANGKTTEIVYDKDFPISSTTPNVQALTYNFQQSVGNLLQRTDVIKNQTENFSFDNLNRLNITNPNYVTQTSATYDGDATASLGNIVTKTDVGYYKYKTGKIHALAYTMNTPTPGQGVVYPTPVSVTPYTEQLITYTPFLKTASITEGVNQLAFMYGPDYERAKTTFNQNGTNVETRIFAGNYEKQVKNGITREIHYIDGGNGLCAIVVKENGIFTPYAVYTDHVGSITTVTNTLGDIIAEQNFDAWGRERDSYNWNVYAASSKPDWLYRGYTGHEMLPYFNLINMNGRMYDPIIGRMLSPDNYVAVPNSSQGYNRYTYALNNPLMFTDPDGNNPIIVAMIIGAAIGAYSGGVTANTGQLNPFKWDNPKTFSYVLGGAIVGAASGALGGYISGAGGAFANTASIFSSSFVNSVGMSIVTAGQTPVTLSFGIASYNMQNGDVGYLGEKGNTFAENLGYGLGAIANIQDGLAGLNPGEVQVQFENLPPEGKKIDLIGHTQIVDAKGNILIDFGPKVTNTADFIKFVPATNSWEDGVQLINKSGNTFTRSHTFKGINVNRLTRISNRLNENPGSYNLTFRSCSSVASRALARSGRYLFGGIYPHTLRLSAILSNAGFRPSLFSYYLN